MNNVNIEQINQIAREAGVIIMGYRGQVTATTKDDNTPVTKADKESSEHIISSLKKLTPDIPVVSEEAMSLVNLPKLDTIARCLSIFNRAGGILFTGNSSHSPDDKYRFNGCSNC